MAIESILIFDPDWSYISENEARTFLSNLTPADLVIYYDHNHKFLLQSLWKKPFESIHYVDLLKKYEPLNYLVKFPWNVARSFHKHLDEKVRQHFYYKEVNLLAIDELFWASQLSWILRDTLILNFIITKYSSLENIYVLSDNDDYSIFVKKEFEIAGYNCQIINSPVLRIKNYNKTKKVFMLRFIEIIVKFVKSIISLRHFFARKNSNKTVILTMHHRSTYPIINFLSKYDTYDLYGLYSSNYKSSNVKIITPNLMNSIFRILIKFSQRTQFNKSVDDQLVNHISNIFISEIQNHYSRKIKGLESLIRQMVLKFFNRLPILMGKIRYYSYVMEKLKPRIVLMHNYISPEQRIICEISKKIKPRIVVMATEHGLMNDLRLTSDIIYSDILGVWGDFSKESYTELQESNRDKISVVGNPLYEYYQQQKIITNLKVLVAPLDFTWSLNYRSSSAVFSPLACEAFKLQLLRDYLKLVKLLKSKRIEFHVLVHPMDDIHFWKTLFNDESINISQGDSQARLSSSDIVVSSNSTLVLDALVKGLEVIVYNPFSSEIYELLFINYLKYNWADICDNIPDIIKLINQLRTGWKVKNDSEKQYIQKTVRYTGNESLLKWLDLIEQVSQRF